MISIAQASEASPMQMPPAATSRSFQQIEQPWPVKTGVVIVGLTIVGAELWWFLGRKQHK
jgi:plastocyanin domain-containing protein